MEPPIPLKGVVLFIAFGSMVSVVLLAVICFYKFKISIQVLPDTEYVYVSSCLIANHLSAILICC